MTSSDSQMNAEVARLRDELLLMRASSRDSAKPHGEVETDSGNKIRNSVN